MYSKKKKSFFLKNLYALSLLFAGLLSLTLMPTSYASLFCVLMDKFSLQKCQLLNFIR